MSETSRAARAHGGRWAFAAGRSRPVRLAVIWIDWYAYHVARFRGLVESPELGGKVAGIELVGGVGVHQGLKFREELPPDLGVTTLLPQASWQTTSQPQLARRLWQCLGRIDPGAVLVPGYYTLPAIAAALWARAHDRPSLLMTESTAYDHRRTRWKEWAKGWLLRLLFDGAVTGGTAHRRYLAMLGFPMARVRGCYDVVDNDGIARKTADLRRTRCAAEFGLPATPYFLYVGRLAPEKNLAMLLTAWFAYREGGGRWPLVLGGDGPENQLLRARAAASGFAEQIVFTGHRSAHQLLPLYAFAGCFVLPSTREPWGLVVNEAMAASLPVLVSERCGSCEDLVLDGENGEGKNGFRFSPDDSGQLTALLERISSMSQTERERMGEQSIRHVTSYSPQRFGSEIASLLREQDAPLLKH